jgi:hypothetical protein
VADIARIPEASIPDKSSSHHVAGRLGCGSTSFEELASKSVPVLAKLAAKWPFLWTATLCFPLALSAALCTLDVEAISPG